jgi:hypothetical protein
MSAGAAHRRHYADNWLIYAVDYAMLFEVTDPGLVNLRLPVPIGGSSNHFRTELLRKVGGWDAWNVTENADLGLRLARFGYKVATFDSETLEDIPAAIPAFLRQRTRWLKGWMQTLFINMRNLRRLTRDLGFVAAACTALGLGSAIIGALFRPAVAFPRRPIRAITGTAKHERNHRQHDLVLQCGFWCDRFIRVDCGRYEAAKLQPFGRGSCYGRFISCWSRSPPGARWSSFGAIRSVGRKPSTDSPKVRAAGPPGCEARLYALLGCDCLSSFDEATCPPSSSSTWARMIASKLSSALKPRS